MPRPPGPARPFVLASQSQARLGVRRRPASLPRGPRLWVGRRAARRGPGREPGTGAGVGVGAARVLTLAPIWLPHWPAWMCTISLMLGACGGRLRDTRGRAGAGCGGSAAPAARSYRLAPARSARLASPRAANRGTPPQTAARALQHQHRASRFGWAARCGAPPAVSARRLRGLGGPAAGRGASLGAPPHTEGRGWRAPGRTIEAPLGSRTPPRLPSRVLPLRQPQPTALQRRPSSPHPFRDQPQVPTPKSEKDASRLPVLWYEGTNKVLGARLDPLGVGEAGKSCSRH